VADHPLRPATDHSLGRPLPHQQANPTRAPPRAINLSPVLPPGVCGISRSFPRLSPTPGQVPTRYSPVRHSPMAEAMNPFDLHVLSMPPAFVLSQDQTLKFIPGSTPSARTEPKPKPEREMGPYSRAPNDSTCARPVGVQRRRPRIPSHPDNDNQQRRDIRSRRRVRFSPYGECRSLVVDSRRQTPAGRRTANIIARRPGVQSRAQKFATPPPGQISPSSRSSASMRSGGGAPWVSRSGGASPSDR
jgi:hypothetical protein